MPYINQDDRQLLDAQAEFPELPGQLNYVITKTINEYYNRQRLGYISINDVIGVLEAAKLEFYRRVAVPYEDKKLLENGDVYNDLPS